MAVAAWLRATAVLTVTLAAGVAIGVGYERQRLSTMSADDIGAQHDAGHSEQMIQHLARELELDSAQRTAVAEVFARRQKTIDSTWNAVQPHVHATLDSTLREIATLLRPDQLVKYRRMVGERHPEILRGADTQPREHGGPDGHK